MERSLAKVLGRNVSIDGPVELELSFWPALKLSDFSIDNLPGTRSPKFVEAGEVKLIQSTDVFQLIRVKYNFFMREGIFGLVT